MWSELSAQQKGLPEVQTLEGRDTTEELWSPDGVSLNSSDRGREETEHDTAAQTHPAKRPHP